MAANTDWERVSLVLSQLQGKVELDNSEDDAQRDSQDSRDELLLTVLSKLRVLCVQAVNIANFATERRISPDEAEELIDLLRDVNNKLKKYEE